MTPHPIQRRAWECAFVLCQDFPELLTLEQHVRLQVITLYDPERLGWDECETALCLYARLVMVRV